MAGELSDIYSALQAGLSACNSLDTWVRSADGRDEVNSRRWTLERGLRAYETLSLDLRDGRRHVETPDDWTPTECYCNTPTCSPPCGWCTDPSNHDEEQD